MTTNAIFTYSKSDFIVRILLGLTLSISHSFRPSITVADITHNMANKTTETPSFPNGWPYRSRNCERLVRRDNSLTTHKSTYEQLSTRLLWIMRSNLQKWNSLDALFKSANYQFVWKCDLNLLSICFRLLIRPNGHRESHKKKIVKRIPRANEAAGLFFLSPYSAHNTCFPRALFIRPRKYMN